jgi:hypothetical protein
VLSDQELIDGLRRELAGVQPPADLIARLREQAAGPRVRRRGSRVPVGSLAVAASLAVAIAITVTALVFVHHRAAKQASGPSTTHLAGGKRVTALAPLVSSFAVLRRPQTAADRAVRIVCPHPCREDLVPGLTRLARTLPDGSRIFLSVWRVRIGGGAAPGGRLGEPAGGYVVDGLVVPKGREAILSPGGLGQIPVVSGGMESGMPSAVVGPRSAPLWTGVVPDGVSTVRWTFSCVQPRRTEACPRATGTSLTTATVSVLDNVAAARIGATRNGAVGAISAVWLDPAGRGLADFSNGQTTMVFPPHGLIHHSRVVLNADGLVTLSHSTIRFGASRARIERLLYPVVGLPTGGYQATLDQCGVDHTLTWPILIDPATGQLERGEDLTVFFHRGRFVGYQWGGNGLHPDAAPLRVRATTAAGLTIGDTLATGQRLYGHAFRISTAQGGTWQVRTAHGKLTGYAYGNPKISDVSPSSVVATIDAGDVGCPALSP